MYILIALTFTRYEKYHFVFINILNTGLFQVRTSDSTVFRYTPGFLRKISTSNVSVDVVRLKLDNVRSLLNMDEEGGSASESETESQSEAEEELDQESLEIDRKLVNIREQRRAEADKKAAELLQKFQEKSNELAAEAERRYREEKEAHQRAMKEEEDRIFEEIRSKRIYSNCTCNRMQPVKTIQIIV